MFWFSLLLPSIYKQFSSPVMPSLILYNQTFLLLHMALRERVARVQNCEERCNITVNSSDNKRRSAWQCVGGGAADLTWGRTSNFSHEQNDKHEHTHTHRAQHFAHKQAPVLIPAACYGVLQDLFFLMSLCLRYSIKPSRGVLENWPLFSQCLRGEGGGKDSTGTWSD